MKTVGALAGVLWLLIAVPIALALGIVLCAVFLLDGILGFVVPVQRKTNTEPRDTSAASIMVLNWNGRAFLEDLLPSLEIACDEHEGDHEILVIDNGSEDDSIEWLAEHHPRARVVRHETNLGFVEGYNRALHEAKKDILVLLNNDMVVDKGFLGPLLAGFQNDDVFAVTAQISFADKTKRQEETGLTGGRLHLGGFKLRHDPVPEHAGEVPVMWAGGGSSAFDRRRFLELGGFDRLYAPFYYEDTSLSFEAWRRGWSVVLAPGSRVVHSHQGSSSRLPANHVARIRSRNDYLFTWRSLLSPLNTARSTLLLPLTLLRRSLSARGSHLFHKAFVESCGLALTLPRLPVLLAGRMCAQGHARRSDREVMEMAHSAHRLARSRGDRAGERLRLLWLMARVPKRGVDGSWAQVELLEELGKDHEITVLAFLEKEDDREHADALAPHVHRLETMLLDPEPGVWDLHHQIPERLRRHYSARSMRDRLEQTLRSERFDVVQVDYVEMAHIVAGLQDQLRGVRSVHVVHEPLFLATERQVRDSRLERLRGFFERARALNWESTMYPRFARLVCLSDRDASALHEWWPRLQTTVVPNGIDASEIEPCEPSRGNRVLFVGYFAHPPNRDGALWLAREVMPKVRAQVSDAELHLVGRGAPPEVLALDGQSGVRVRGFVADLRACLCECALSLAPMREGGGLRSKVLEACAHGRTIVSTRVSAAGFAVEDNVHVRLADDSDGFAAAIVELLRDDTKRHAMENASRQLVRERYTRERAAQGYVDVYRQLCEEDGR